MSIKTKAINNLTAFLEYIAQSDEGLRDELKNKGAVNIIKEAIYLTGSISAILTLWVVL